MDTARVGSQNETEALQRTQASPPVRRNPETRVPERPQEEAHPSRTEPREDVRVEISDRARELRSQRDTRETPPKELQATRPGSPPPAAPETTATNVPILAVAQGVPPVETLDRTAEEVVREQLAERAGIRRMDRVLRTSDEAESVRVEAQDLARRDAMTLPGAGNETAELRLPGAEAAQAPSKAPVELERPGAPVPNNAETAHRAVVNEVRAELRQADKRQDLEMAFAAATQSGVARSEEAAEQRRHDPQLMGESEDSERERIAREVLTQAGVVEAQSEAELVTRFGERAFAQDLGRPPRLSEQLGHRSVPDSRYEP